MTKGWFGKKQQHSMAAKGIKTKIHLIGNRKYGFEVIWKQQDENGKMKIFKEIFETQYEAEKHKEKLLYSAKSIGKPLKIIEINEIKKK